MRFYLQERKRGAATRFSFPIIPDKVNANSGANTIPLTIIGKGEMRIPRGEKATGYSWESILPGASMSAQSFVHNWKDPKIAAAKLEKWKREGTELRFMAGKLIDDYVFIETFNKTYFGLGHIRYSITLTKYPELKVTTSPAPAPRKSKSGSDSAYPTGVTTGTVVYRKGPGKSYKKLGSLKKGETVTIYATKGNWYKIKESPEWWVCSSYVKITSGLAETTTKTQGARKAPARNPTSNQGNEDRQPLVVKVPTAQRVQVARTAAKVTFTAQQAAPIRRVQFTK